MIYAWRKPLMFKDPYHPDGWKRLFQALNTPCECERGITHDGNGKMLNCHRKPLPYVGYRWYHRELVDDRSILLRLSQNISCQVRPPMRGRRVRCAA